MKAPRAVLYCATLAAFVRLFILPVSGQDTADATSISDADIAKRATDDLAALYADSNTVPPYEKAIKQLQDKDEATRTAAGKYLPALLAQSYADQMAGRAPQKSLPFWGGGVENAAVELRKQIAQKLADAGGGDAGLDAAQWLIDKEPVLENQANGFKFVAATRSPRADEITRAILAAPHHNAEVLIAAIKEAAARKLAVAPEITRLCNWYRKSVRDAARGAAAKLGIKSIPEFKPEEAFTPWLDAEMKQIAAMPYPEIPKDAKWMRFAQARDPSADSKMLSFPGEVVTEFKDGKLQVKTVMRPPPAPGTSGWLLEDKDGKLRAMDYFGSTFEIDGKTADPKPRTFAGEAAVFADARKRPINSPEDMNAREQVLSIRGGLSGQFEPSYISSPEALVAAWSYAQGDKKLAAEIIFPRIDESPDDLEFAAQVRELIGKVYQQKMLDAFCEARDYDEAVRVAKHLSEPEFDGYFYQGRAKELVAQLQKRGDDFKQFALPAAEEWTKQKAGMKREEQIKFLAGHLRLLNCFQMMQPGGVDYGEPQTAGPSGTANIKLVINPFNELRAMKMTGSELAALAPFIKDEDFMPTYSYWRDFHPGRDLHRVNWAVQALINEVAGTNIVDVGNFQSLTPDEKQQAVDKVLAWCKENGSKSFDARVLDTLSTAKNWNDFAHAASLAIESKIPAAALVMEKRLADFPSNHGDILEICYNLNSPQAVPFAHDWLSSNSKVGGGAWIDEDTMRFWCAMMTLRASKPDAPEGLDVLKALLAKDTDGQWYPFAFDLLMSLKTKEATDIACGALKKTGASGGDTEVAKQLFLAGRQEALDYMLAWLDNNGDGGTSWTNNSDGTQKTAKLEAGDNAASAIAGWRTDKYSYDVFRPVPQRRSDREKLKQWLKEQFALVKAGKQSAISPPGTVQGSHPVLDAP